jgi:hypothetical protein
VRRPALPSELEPWAEFYLASGIHNFKVFKLEPHIPAQIELHSTKTINVAPLPTDP